MSDWSRDEPSFAVALRQLGHLARRGARRPWLALLWAALLGAGVVAMLHLKGQTFAPRYVLRVVEADRDKDTAPRTKRRLREHVMNAVFSAGRLSEVMERHNLYPSLRQANPQAALESFRNDIEVDVFRNFFMEERWGDAPPRSARIVVRYRVGDPDVSLEVTQALGRLIVEHESTMRHAQAQSAAAAATEATQRAREMLFAAKRRLMEGRLTADPSEQNFVELIGLQRSIENLERLVDQAERRQATFEVGETMEKLRMGLTFEEIDTGSVRRADIRTTEDMVRVGLLTLVFVSPLMLVGVGAADKKLRTLADVHRLGFQPLARVAMDRERSSAA